MNDGVKKWDEIYDRLMANRTRERFPKDWGIEEECVKELEAQFEKLTYAERRTVRRPVPPQRMSLIVHRLGGELFEFEDDE